MYRLLFVLLSAFFWARLAHNLGHPGSILGHLGFILDHLGSIWGHPGSILAPQSLPKLAQTEPDCPQRRPDAPQRPPKQQIIKAQQNPREGIDFWTNSRRNLKGRFSRGFCSNDPFSRVLHKMLKNHKKSISSPDFFDYFFANGFFDNLLKRGVHQTPTLHYRKRFWPTVNACERS